MITDKPLILDKIECALAAYRQPARIVRVTGYGLRFYIHMELSMPIDLSDRRAYDAVLHAAGYAPEWAAGESWLGFRRAAGMFPLNPVENNIKSFEWRA